MLRRVLSSLLFPFHCWWLIPDSLVQHCFLWRVYVPFPPVSLLDNAPLFPVSLLGKTPLFHHPFHCWASMTGPWPDAPHNSHILDILRRTNSPNFNIPVLSDRG